MAPVSQIRAGPPPGRLPGAAGKDFALVAALPQPLDHAGARGARMPPILLEHQRELLANEFRPRHAALAGRSREQAVIRGIKGDRRRLLPGECHGSNITFPRPWRYSAW